MLFKVIDVLKPVLTTAMMRPIFASIYFGRISWCNWGCCALPLAYQQFEQALRKHALEEGCAPQELRISLEWSEFKW